MTAPANPARYDAIGVGYAGNRRADARIAARIHAALGDAERIVNVGAGAGSYEPTGRFVVAVDPSATMLAQHAARRRLQGVVERLPVPDGAFDASLASLTIHHWTDWRAGLSEMRRVSRRQVIFGCDTSVRVGHWIVDEYLPEMRSTQFWGDPTVDDVLDALGGGTVVPVPIPHDCTDGFLAAYWRRPAWYLDPAITASISGIAMLPPALRERGMQRLAADLESGRWHERHADLLELDELDAGYCLVVSG